MLVSRFVWWFPCQAVLMALFAVLFIQLSGAENVCYLGACPGPWADRVARVATYRMVADQPPSDSDTSARSSSSVNLDVRWPIVNV